MQLHVKELNELIRNATATLQTENSSLQARLSINIDLFKTLDMNYAEQGKKFTQLKKLIREYADGKMSIAQLLDATSTRQAGQAE